MPEQRRITFNTDSPNDQGGIIPGACIDFNERFNANPVLLEQHNWEGLPLGKMTDIKFEAGKWTGLPVFHEETESAKIYKALYEKGFLNACSIGGEAIWRKNNRGDYEENADGFRICDKFILYEISMVTLPSNPDAVAQLAAKGELETVKKLQARFITPEEKQGVMTKLSAYRPESASPDKVIEAMRAIKTIPTQTQEKTTLTTTLKHTTMADTLEVTELTAEEKAEIAAKRKLAADEKTRLAAEAKDGEGLPGWFKKLIGLGTKVTFEPHAPVAPTTLATPPPTKMDAPKPDKPKGTEVTEPGADAATEKQPTPIGLKAEKEKKALDKAKDKAADAIEKAKAAKEMAEKEDATDEHKDMFKKAAEAAKECMSDMEAKEKAYNDAMDEDDDEGGDEAAKPKHKETEKTKNAATGGTGTPRYQITKLTTAELLSAGAKIIPMERNARVMGDNSNIPKFSKLFSYGENGKLKAQDKAFTEIDERERGKVTYDSVEKSRILLASLMKDEKYSAVLDKARFNFNQQGKLLDPMNRVGLTTKDIATRLATGNYEVYGADNRTRRGGEMTMLTATDTFLASPDLYAIEFLPLVIFQLFPSNSWKADISIFGATMTSENTGFVFANIEAAPAVYIGSQPSNPADYTYTDAAVALNLTPFFLQPMLWTPWLMHQLRYDQMGTGWAQAFADWAATIDDVLIYNLASTVPAGSIISSTGISGYNTTAQSIAITANGINSFVWNPTFAGTLLKPVLNDITTLEQLYWKQNFMLDQNNQKPTVVLDPTAYTAIVQDPQFQSLLTRWINGAGASFVNYTNTSINQRSRVAIYDPATGQVKNPYGSIPSTAISANLSFIPSQVGIAIGSLDVFMLQSPKNYGYEMSANIRSGIVPLRNTYNGTALYTYGAPAVGPV